MFLFQGLPDKDLIGKSDPYAKIYLLDGNNSKFVDHNKKLKTRTMKNNQNPDFHEGFEFKVLEVTAIIMLVIPILTHFPKLKTLIHYTKSEVFKLYDILC